MLDLLTNRIVRIPTLRSSPDRLPCECPCGIHSMAMNPSRTLLATGGDNVNDVAIYRLPTFDPVCVGEVLLPALHIVQLPMMSQKVPTALASRQCIEKAEHLTCIR